MIETLKPKIKHYFKGISHDFFHTERVYNLVLKIAAKEGGDIEVIKAAALLHDIARYKEDENPMLCHAEESAKLAPKILKSIGFPEQKTDKVIHCILVHRYSKGLKAETKEAKILQDADRLDAIGAIAAARLFSFSGTMKRPIYDPDIKPKEEYDGDSETSINHFYEKILKIKPEPFNTETAKKIAEERHDFIEKYVERFFEEWNGEK